MIIGMTGPSGAGKTTLGKILSKRGFVTIDVDKLAKNLYLPGNKGYGTLKRLYGKGIVGPSGRIDRKKLAGLVFSSPRELRRLDQALKPLILQSLKAEIKRLQSRGKADIALDMATLLKSGAEKLVDSVWLVEAPLKNRVQRLVLRRKLPRERALAQATSLQEPDKRKIDVIIRNDGSLGELEAAVAASLKGNRHAS